MTIRLGGPLVGALAGLAAAAVGAVFLAESLDGRTIILAAGPVLLGAAVAAATARSIAPAADTTAETSGPGPCAADRAALVEACVWMRDRATSPALAQHLDQVFAHVGVEPVDATGQRFDPAVHEAGGAIQAHSAAEDGIIARTETPGYTDRGRLLRHPVVTVYRGQVRA